MFNRIHYFQSLSYLFFLSLIYFSIFATTNSYLFRGNNNHNSNSFRPVIGILTQPSPFKDFGFPSNKYSYIAGSYVQYIESAGAEVVPIQWDLPKQELDALLKKINGVLFPGGGTALVNTTTKKPTLFSEQGNHILQQALEFNRNHDHFPVWGTCLGYELLTLAISGNWSLLISVVDGDDVARPINITKEGLNGLYANMDPNLINDTLTKNLSYFHHVKTPDPLSFTQNINLSSNFSVVGWTYDSKAGSYVANIQGKVHPFFGNQFHPEKNTFEWQSGEHINHSLEAINFQQYHASSFVNQSMLSKHAFDSQSEFFNYSIYNFQPKHLQVDPQFQEVYLFNNYKVHDESIEFVSEYPKWSKAPIGKINEASSILEATLENKKEISPKNYIFSKIMIE